MLKQNVMVRPAQIAFPFTVLLVLVVSGWHGAFGQGTTPVASPASSAQAASKPAAGTSSVLTGTGEQMRAIAAVCDVWEKARLLKKKMGGKDDSADIRDYTFRVTEEGAVYKVTLWPKKPVVKRIPTPSGVYLQNDSSTFFYDVRRSDFKIVAMSAIM